MKIKSWLFVVLLLLCVCMVACSFAEAGATDQAEEKSPLEKRIEQRQKELEEKAEEENHHYVGVGKNADIKKLLLPKNKEKMVWSSSNEEAAVVSDKGQVKGIAVGETVITAKSAETGEVLGSCRVSVVVPVKKITFTDKKIEMPAGMTWKLETTVLPEDATHKGLIWTSSNEKVVTVSDEGEITAVSNGTAKITATAADESGSKATINVRVDYFDLVFYDQSSKSETLYTTVYAADRIKISTKNKTVDVQQSGYGTMITPTGIHYEVTYTITPIKPGTDTLTFKFGNAKTYKIFVSPKAFPAPDVTEEKDAKDVFADIEWGAAYPEAREILAGQGIEIKNPVKRNDFLRAQINEGISFSTYTATSAALDFSYGPDDSNYMSNNSLFRKIYYFDPETPFDQLCQAVVNTYILDEGDLQEDVCTWKKEDITVTLSQKDRYIILEVIKGAERSYS